MKIRNVLLVVIFSLCVGLMYLPSRIKSPPQAVDPAQVEQLPTAITLKRLGKRSGLVYHFRHLFDISDWRQVTTTTKDEIQGISDNEHIIIIFGNDPITYAKLVVDLKGNDKVGARVIVEFLDQFLDGTEYDAAIRLLDGGGELNFTDRHILIYQDVEIGKAIFEIKWTGK